jgi:hypothetical protein
VVASFVNAYAMLLLFYGLVNLGQTTNSKV